MQEKALQIQPDFNTDVLWRPPRIGTRMRTLSTDSNGSDLADTPSATTGGRRFSFTEMLAGPIFGRQRSVSESSDSSPVIHKKQSITDNVDFKEFMRRQNKILEEQ